MKGIVAYDSVHGSTRRVAEAMAEQIRSEGHEAQLVFVREWAKGPLEGDFLFIGSPTRGGRMTKEAKEFIEALDVAYWKGRRIVTFDTLGPLSKDPEKRRKALEGIGDSAKSAGPRMRDALERRGLQVAGIWHFAVVGMWGPEAPDAPELAKGKARSFLAEMASVP